MAATDAKLITQIARILDHEPAQICAWCENARGEFRAITEDEIGATEKRDKLRAITETCRAAAEAVGARALQDDDWLPKGEFAVGRRRFEISAGSTKLATLLWLLSEVAAKAAAALKTPKAKTIPEKDATACFAYMLVSEFPPRNKGVRISFEGTTDAAWYAKRIPSAAKAVAGPKRRQAEIVAENWHRLSPTYRDAYNGLLQARGLALLPPPAKDCYVPPRRGSSTPRKVYLLVAPLLFEYFTGQKPDGGLERSCRKVLSRSRK